MTNTIVPFPGDYYQWTPTLPYQAPTIWYSSTLPTPPVECSGDVHVFPCPHCAKCKCGKATVKR